MPTFFENDLTLQSYWRSIILYGRNVASYKFALAKALIDLSKNNKELIKLDDLAAPYSNHICEHLKKNDKQITSKNSKFLNVLRDFNHGNIDFDKKNELTKKLGFNDVLDAFHVVNGKTIPNTFFIDERITNNGIRLTDNFFKLFDLQESENFMEEVEARWRLVETAWQEGLSVRLTQVEFDQISGKLFINNRALKRIDVTSSKSGLNGYQKSKCFFCFDYISIIKQTSDLCNVDHFFPDMLKGKNFSGYVDGIWNLVLACRECNRGTGGKFAKLPSIKLLERLHKRNEYLCSSNLPLGDVIKKQTGKTEKDRKMFLQKCFNEAKEILVHDWQPKAKGVETF